MSNMPVANVRTYEEAHRIKLGLLEMLDPDRSQVEIADRIGPAILLINNLLDERLHLRFLITRQEERNAQQSRRDDAQ
jgi:hypothetical protein